MKMHVIFKVDRPVKPVSMAVMGQAKAEFPIAGVVSFGKITRYYCTIDVAKPDHVCAHIETTDDAGFVSALLHEKMFTAIHKFFDLMMDGKRLNVSYLAGMYIEFGHFMLNVPEKSLILPNVLESYLDITMDFNYDLLETEMEHLQYDAKALRIGNDPNTAVIIPFCNGTFDMKRHMGWTYTASTYNTADHTIHPKVYQMVMNALDQLEKMEPEQQLYCIDDIKHPWKKKRSSVHERFDVSSVVIHYTRNGMPKEIALQGVFG